MSIFEFENYKDFILSWIRERPKQGRGESGKLAKVPCLHSTMMSHILRGDSRFSSPSQLATESFRAPL